jgi:hypothetical protein
MFPVTAPSETIVRFTTESSASRRRQCASNALRSSAGKDRHRRTRRVGLVLEERVARLDVTEYQHGA